MNDEELIEKLYHEAQSLKLLYVEDDLTLCDNTKIMLEDFFDIVVRHNGVEGLQSYEEESFDIVLTDVVMPKMDGREMSRKIRQKSPDQVIIVMSAYEEAQYFMELIDIGISSFVPKPPSLHQLFSTLLSACIKINNAKKVEALSLEMKADLRESKELLRSIIDNVAVRIFWKDKESRYLGCNKLFLQDFNLNDASELIGKTDFEMPWYKYAQDYVNDDQLVMKTQQNKLNYEERLVSATGERWLLTSKVVLYDEKHEPMGILGTYTDITEHKALVASMHQAQEALGHQAHHDVLTGLPNRLLYLKKLQEAMTRIDRKGGKIAVIFLDIDKFKDINDSLGHDIGDEVIMIVGERLKKQLRRNDLISRFGGDEFVLMIDDLKTINDVSDIVDKIMHSMDESFVVDEHHLHITVSIGVSIYPDDGTTSQVLIRNADTAMYLAKDAGRNRYRFYKEEMTSKSLTHITMVKDIKAGLKNREFMLYYQPQIDLQQKKILGIEALLRWNHPDKGIVLPEVFISVAEDANLINKLGVGVFEEACTQIKRWYEMGYNPGRIAINCSAIEVEKGNFDQFLDTELEKIGCDPDWVELEITEGYMLKHPEDSVKILQRIRDMGIHLAIDDFGTGYSSLSYLKRLPFHKLKIDRSFIEDVVENDQDEAIVESIISLAKNMKMEVIAEGVETQEQEKLLSAKGCHKMQGYLYAKPMPADEMEQFLKNFNQDKMS